MRYKADQMGLDARLVFLFGTRHDYQRPGSPGSEDFHVEIVRRCREHGIKAIAEEMSLDALRRFGAHESVCKRVGDSLGLTHRYCDPSIEEQKMLGIANPGRVGASGFSPVAHEVDPGVQRENAIRRRYWLERIIELNAWPMLFVCGAVHTESFRELLHASNIVGNVLCGNWAPLISDASPLS